jgi:ATP-dependent helicase/nuclease subunit A
MDDATARQIVASDPVASTWLSANAGSGKTKVLTDRVARLLIGGTEPGRILCLTYTKAAAAEMQIRLFRQLGGWAMLDDAKLAEALGGLGVAAVDAGRLAEARRLFARAIETPGGLRIQTIHAFCAALLRRFPLEAGVSPLFSEADERSIALLRSEIVEDMADGPEAGLVDALAADHSGGDFEALTASIAARRDRFATPLDLAGALSALGAPAGLDRDGVLAAAFAGDEGSVLAHAAEVMAAGLQSDQAAAATMKALVPAMAAPDLGDLRALEDLLLYRGEATDPFGPKSDRMPTKALRNRHPDVFTPLAALMQRVAHARRLRVALAAAERTVVLHRFAKAFVRHYEAAKARHGWLDFDDLITRASGLLAASPLAQWVLYRLDGGLDHILVDEAQDTSPGQWAVIARLAEEMTAGEGARDGVPRTLFVVGDKKQSIYSFQGADLLAFDRVQGQFSAQMALSQAPLRSLTLDHSFRSSVAILRAVDATFAPEGEAALGTEVRHLAFQGAMPGRVELWPAPEAEPAADEGDWTDPVDRPGPGDPEAVLARKIAAHVRDLIAAGTTIPTRAGPRRMHEGDVLILVQQRRRLFAELIAACKAAGLQVAGADRLRLGGEMAVRDIAALLSFIANPADDLGLATALRSPLFGWDEERLHALAQGRSGDLWSALRQDSASAAVVAVLGDLRDRSDFLRPFDLIDRILTRHDGRRRLIARLGAEAEDGIDQLLAQAMAYERDSVPSLTGFLGWIEGADVEVRRQADAAGARLRVMTVHGAKGLEAPIVILPDCGDRRVSDRDEIVLAEGLPPLRRAASKEERPDAIARAHDESGARAEAERRRLLYVGMTRAEAWLIVATPSVPRSGQSWHKLVEEGLRRAGAEACDTPTGTGLRLAHGAWPAADSVALARTAPPALPVLPDWARTRPRPAAFVPDWISPTDLGGAKVLGEAGADATESMGAMAYGSALHLLLEHLPDVPTAERAAIAARLVPDAALRAPAVAQAVALIDAPTLRDVFHPGAGATVMREVALATPGPGGIPLMGIIDRLILTEGRALAIDYKTNRIVPADADAVPEGLVRQMSAYRHALGAIMPGRRIEIAILWTATGQMMTLDPAALDRAATEIGLGGAASGDLDAGGGDP